MLPKGHSRDDACVPGEVVAMPKRMLPRRAVVTFPAVARRGRASRHHPR